MSEPSITRRDLLRAGALGTVGLAAGGSVLALPGLGQDNGKAAQGQASHHDMMTVGQLAPGTANPTEFLTNFDYGRVSTLPSGQRLREYELVADDREIEVAPGVFYPAWTYNGQVPGPTIRCTEGDRIRIRFTNHGKHSHSIHFHGIHPSNMDGAFEPVHPGRSFLYEFDAEPFGLHLYHCHTVPIKRHIHKGLYGVFIIDPKQGRPPAREMVMVTNSFHLHGNVYRLYRTGTDLERYELTDNVMLCQGERAILEFTYKYPGLFMFHAHQSEFAELGWSGMFNVQEALR